MACFGLGVTRIFQAIAEFSRDEHGILWPSEIAPYKIVILCAPQVFKKSMRTGGTIGELRERFISVAGDLSLLIESQHDFEDWRGQVVIDDRFITQYRAAVFGLGIPLIITLTNDRSGNLQMYVSNRHSCDLKESGPFNSEAHVLDHLRRSKQQD